MQQNKIKNNPLVKLENAGVHRDTRWLVRGVSFELYRNNIVTLIGPNGSGKTTTGKLILNILEPDEGRISLNTKRIAYVPQKLNINSTVPLRVKDFMTLTEHISQSTIIENLKLTGVEKLYNNNLIDLSGGEFQRVLLARAIAKNPDLLILDEPVQGVDFQGEIKLYKLIKEILDEINCGILLISHDLHFVMSSTDHVICLNNHVCCSGSPRDVAQNSSYIELFGEQAASTFSVYSHNHDHMHNQDGSISK
jgi:zinc transport system ATP-binding protein